MEGERKYYLAVVRPENFQKLLKSGLSFYAVRKGSKIKNGDQIVLYRSRGGSARGGDAGIVGTFEVIADPRPVARGAAARDFFQSLYPIQIPWRALVTTLDRPLPIAPLVAELQIFPNKQQYGSALQTTMKALPRHDYEVINEALKRHIAGRGDVSPG